MNGDTLVKELVDLISAIPDIDVSRSSISKMGKVFELNGTLKGYLYLKSIAHRPYRWGITKNTVDKIKAKGSPWCIVLLYKSKQTGYLIPSGEYDNRVSRNLWPFHQGDYKITDGKSLVGIPKFSTVEQLVSLISNKLAYVSPTISLIQKAIQETKPIRQKSTQLSGGGESSSHKELKEYVASNPNLIGLPKDVASFMEYAFPSGDQVDIAFLFDYNKWAVVEIEIEGLIPNLIGLFQVVKYRALQEAILKTQRTLGQVEGYLVSNSIPEEIKGLADILDIRTKEIVL